MTPLDPARTAIVAAHLQNDIVGADRPFAAFFPTEPQRAGFQGAILRVLDGARAAGVKVVYTRIAYQPGYPDMVGNAPHQDLVKRKGVLVEGTPGAAIIDEVKPQASDFILTHQRTSGFHGTLLDAVLRGAGVDTVAIFGVATNLTVEGTAREAADLGYRTLIISDASATFSQSAHKASLETMDLLAEVVTSDELLAAFTPPAEGA
ncbi:cysteine hydrolase family protein [Nocardia vaccinii]|uniref:cysteine hydrolase family protein n=1 Tax=Nocardia vaccinii TaxID=1822 RepID=UPI00082D4936|nr:cysteine hydrolase [Nocardia vaccinii]